MSVSVLDAPLPVVDGLELSARHRELLNPGGFLVGRDGETHRLPRYFYEIDSWDRALATPLSAHFGLWEFIDDGGRPEPARHRQSDLRPLPARDRGTRARRSIASTARVTSGR